MRIDEEMERARSRLATLVCFYLTNRNLTLSSQWPGTNVAATPEIRKVELILVSSILLHHIHILKPYVITAL